jgi:hypothetical protein
VCDVTIANNRQTVNFFLNVFLGKVNLQKGLMISGLQKFMVKMLKMFPNRNILFRAFPSILQRAPAAPMGSGVFLANCISFSMAGTTWKSSLPAEDSIVIHTNQNLEGIGGRAGGELDGSSGFSEGKTMGD